MSIIRPFIAVHREKNLIKMLIIYPNFKIYFHKWYQFKSTGDKLSHHLYISLFDICFYPLTLS